MNLTAALLVVLAGLAVGATSIGGILVVPTLTVAADVPVHAAIAASNFSFLFTGAAAIAFQRALQRAAPRSAQPPLTGLYMAALAGAALGALTLQWLPSSLIRAVVAVLAVLSGSMALVQAKHGDAPTTARGWMRGPVMLALGVAVGCGSAWSGTGGPVLLLPVLIFARVPTALAIAMAQGIQLPIAGAASAVNLLSGQLDLGIGLMLGALLMLGWGAGFAFARRVPAAALRRLLALALITVGLAYGWQPLKEAFA